MNESVEMWHENSRQKDNKVRVVPVSAMRRTKTVMSSSKQALYSSTLSHPFLCFSSNKTFPLFLSLHFFNSLFPQNACPFYYDYVTPILINLVMSILLSLSQNHKHAFCSFSEKLAHSVSLKSCFWLFYTCH